MPCRVMAMHGVLARARDSATDVTITAGVVHICGLKTGSHACAHFLAANDSSESMDPCKPAALLSLKIVHMA